MAHLLILAEEHLEVVEGSVDLEEDLVAAEDLVAMVDLQ
jgi:hypothetical protein